MKRLSNSLGLAASILAVVATAVSAAAERLPNIVLIFTDDQGYSDVGCFGAKGFETPHLDRMADEGIRFTNFYVAQAVCGASRAALLTGCYPNRIGMYGAPGPGSRRGIHDDEMLLSELVKQRGYATALFGKWHLGDDPQFLPQRHGFDEYFGLPYSNDMWPFHPTCGDRYPPLPLVEGEKIVEYNPDQTKLTTQYTERAVSFIERNKDKPFFLYLAHSMPHVPLFVSQKHDGSSADGLYGDVIEEIDWSVGQVLASLKKHGLEDDTLVIFTTDNGPWIGYGNHGGTARPLREGKATAWEGGVRVPCIMKWPNKIPAGGVCDKTAATIDILPTIAKLIDAKPPEHKIDGKDIWPLMTGEYAAPSPHTAFFFYWGRGLHAVRSDRWKLHFPHEYRSLLALPGRFGRPGRYIQRRTELALYNLDDDVSETVNVADAHPDVVRRLSEFGAAARVEMGDSLTGVTGNATRLPGQLK
jgi:arylsulfatase A-like enzyme